MRKRVYGRRLSRDTNERKALFRSLATALVTHGRIDTTEAKAKAIRPWVEKLVTRSKTNDLNSRRFLLENIPSTWVVEKLVSSIGPVFSKRPGGYTRLIRLGPRAGDNAPMARLEFVEEIKEVKQAKTKLAKKVTPKTTKARKPLATKKPAPRKTKRSTK